MRKWDRCFLSIFFFILTGLHPYAVIGQDTGIRFESGLSWQEILLKAKAENKYVFVDCYASWCGPCKWMNRNIFPQKAVGDFFNAHFINVSVQMDQMPKDAQAIREWYTDANNLSQTYGISAYPTYLFFSPDGRAVHHVVGSTKTAEEFISDGKDALDPTKQYYTTIKGWEDHKGDSVFLFRALTNALAISDRENATAIGEAYMESINNPFSLENIRKIDELIQLNNTSKSKFFAFFANYASKINEIMGNDKFVQRELGWSIIANEEMRKFFTKKKFPIKWDTISANIRLKYPMLGEGLIEILRYQFRNFVIDEIRAVVADQKASTIKNWHTVAKAIKGEIVGFDSQQVLLEEEARYYAIKKLWSKCAKASFSLMGKFGGQLGQRGINHIGWDYAFEHFNKKRVLLETLKWMKYYIDLEPNRQENIDTYANLLYKIGKRNDAIVWEKKAIGLAENNSNFPEDLKEFKAALNKMENGIATWKVNTSNN